MMGDVGRYFVESMQGNKWWKLDLFVNQSLIEMVASYVLL